MGKIIIIKGADFSANAVSKDIVKIKDEGYVHAAYLSDGMIQFNATNFISTVYRRVQPNSQVIINIVNDAMRQLLIKVCEYDVDKNFIRRIYNADYATVKNPYSYAFTVGETTKYIRIGVEYVSNDMSSIICNEIVSGMSIVGSVDDVFDASKYTEYTD